MNLWYERIAFVTSVINRQHCKAWSLSLFIACTKLIFFSAHLCEALRNKYNVNMIGMFFFSVRSFTRSVLFIRFMYFCNLIISLIAQFSSGKWEDTTCVNLLESIKTIAASRIFPWKKKKNCSINTHDYIELVIGLAVAIMTVFFFF